MTKKERKAGVSETGGNIATLHITLSQFRLPPVRDALIVGKRASVGPKALYEALKVIAPEQFKLIPIENSVAEAVIVRHSDLRKIPEEKLVPTITEAAERFMDESDCLRADIEIEISTTREVSL